LANAEEATAEVVEQEAIAELEVATDEQAANALTVESAEAMMTAALAAGLAPLDEKILGLETSLTTLTATVNDLATQVAQLQQDAAEEQVTALSLVDLLATNLNTNSLNVNGQATIIGGLSVDMLSATGDMLQIISNTSFIGRPYFNTDTAGFAVIKAGAQEVAVTFTEPYAQQPIVNASITLDEIVDDPATFEIDESLSNIELAQDYLSNLSPYLIYRKSQTGFVIRLAEPATQDTAFSWTAWAVDGPLTAFSVPGAFILTPVEVIEEPVILPQGPVAPSNPEPETESQGEIVEPSQDPVTVIIPEIIPAEEPVVEEIISTDGGSAVEEASPVAGAVPPEETAIIEVVSVEETAPVEESAPVQVQAEAPPAPAESAPAESAPTTE
jgi:hypothetical protein